MHNTTTTALASAPTPSTGTIGAVTYCVSQTINGCESVRAQISVTVNALPNALTATVSYRQGALVAQLTPTRTGLKWHTNNITTTGLASAPTPATTAAGTVNCFVSQTTNGC